MKKLKTFDSSWVDIIGKSDFRGDGTQSYLVFHSMYRYFKIIAGIGNGNNIYYWQSKGLSVERISSSTTSNYSVTPDLNYYSTKTRVGFYGVCLKQGKVTFNHGKVVNIYIVYETAKIVNFVNIAVMTIIQN